MNKFEKLIEYIINDEDQKARELFHDIVVEKSRDIYESIMDEESMEENVHGMKVDDMVDEVESEEAMAEDDDEFAMDAGDEDEVGGDFPANDAEGDDFGGEEEFGGEESEEEKIMNIDAKLDELLAKFDEIMGDGGEEPADEFGGDEFAGDEGDEEPADEFGGEEEMGGEEEGMFEAKSGSGNPFAKSGSGKSGSAASGKSGKSGSAASGKSGKSGKGSAELMREYVDRIGDIYGGEGDAAEGTPVGTGSQSKKAPTNSKSITGPGADFGGNVIKRTGADNETPDGKPVPKPSNEYNKGQGVIKSGNINVPGGKAGGAFKSKETAKAGEGQTTDGSVPVAKKSVQVQNTGRK